MTAQPEAQEISSVSSIQIQQQNNQKTAGKFRLDKEQPFYNSFQYFSCSYIVDLVVYFIENEAFPVKNSASSSGKFIASAAMLSTSVLIF